MLAIFFTTHLWIFKHVYYADVNVGFKESQGIGNGKR